MFNVENVRISLDQKSTVQIKVQELNYWKHAFLTHMFTNRRDYLWIFFFSDSLHYNSWV